MGSHDLERRACTILDWAGGIQDYAEWVREISRNGVWTYKRRYRRSPNIFKRGCHMSIGGLRWAYVPAEVLVWGLE